MEKDEAVVRANRFIRHNHALTLLLKAISQARDEGENIPDWLDKAETRAIEFIEGDTD